jgi:hypothetical protein
VLTVLVYIGVKVVWDFMAGYDHAHEAEEAARAAQALWRASVGVSSETETCDDGTMMQPVRELIGPPGPITHDKGASFPERVVPAKLVIRCGQRTYERDAPVEEGVVTP